MKNLKKFLSMALCFAMLATTTVLASPIKIGVEDQEEISVSNPELPQQSQLFADTEAASFKGQVPSTEHLGDIAAYLSFNSSSASADQLHTDLWAGSLGGWRSDATFKVEGYATNFQMEISAAAGEYSLDAEAENSTDLYFTSKPSAAVTSSTDPKFAFGGGNGFLPQGRYIAVLEVKFPESSAATSFTWGFSGASKTFEPSKDNTWTTVVTSPFVTDGTKSTTVNLNVAFDSENATAAACQYSFDNFALYRVSDTVEITFDAGAGTMSQNKVNAYKYVNLSDYTPTAPNGLKFAGWSATSSGSVITDKEYFTNSDVTLYAVYENAAKFHGNPNLDFTAFNNNLLLFENFDGADFVNGAPINDSNKYKVGDNCYRHSDFTLNTWIESGSGSVVSVQKINSDDTNQAIQFKRDSTKKEWSAQSSFSIAPGMSTGTSYVVVFDAYFSTDSVANGINYGSTVPGDIKKVAVTDSMKGKWTTIISPAIFCTDNSVNFCNYVNVSYSKTPENDAQDKYYIDNYALYALNNRTITLVTNTDMGTLSSNSITVDGFYADFSSLTATPAKDYVFAGLRVVDDDPTNDNELIQLTQRDFVVAQDITLEAVWKNTLRRGNLDTSSFGTRVAYVSFNTLASDALSKSPWSGSLNAEKDGTSTFIDGRNFGMNAVTNATCTIKDDETGSDKYVEVSLNAIAEYTTCPTVNFGGNSSSILPEGKYYAVIDYFFPQDSAVTSVSNRFTSGNFGNSLPITDSDKGKWISIATTPFYTDGTGYTDTKINFGVQYDNTVEDLSKYTFLFDNITIYRATEKVTVTFDAGEGTLDTTPVETLGNIDLSAFVPTPKEGEVFVGWSKTADGAIIASAKTEFTDDVTLYAVYAQSTAPKHRDIQMRVDNATDENSIRGIRAIASVSTEQLDKENIEFGYLVTRKTLLGTSSAQSTLVFDSDLYSAKKIITGTAYKKNGDVVSKKTLYDLDGENTWFSGVFTGVPKNMLSDVLVFRSYITVDGETTYGAPIEASITEISQAIYNLTNYAGLDRNTRLYIKNVLGI